jgi:Skp family chaperone for outer membrane proteins
MFAESAFGKRVAAEVDAAARALAAENTALSEELDAEEKALTAERDSLSIEDFSAKADTFDVKVKRIRAEQLTKERELTELHQTGETRFRELARPVLRAIMDRYNAAVLMDLRAILIALDTADVTDEAIAEINARIGDGSMAESGQQQ